MIFKIGTTKRENKTLTSLNTITNKKHFLQSTGTLSMFIFLYQREFYKSVDGYEIAYCFRYTQVMCTVLGEKLFQIHLFLMTSTKMVVQKT